MAENYKEIFRFFPKKGADELMIGSIFGAFSNLSSSVYDKYLDRLCKLREEEINRIYNAYKMIRFAARVNDKDRGFPDNFLQKHLFRVSKDVLESLDYALELKPFGKKWKDELAKLSEETLKK